jgi:hypothetical protein
LREKGVPAKRMIPKCTDRDFLWYQYGKYREIPTDTDRKIPIGYTNLVFSLFLYFSYVAEKLSIHATAFLPTSEYYDSRDTTHIKHAKKHHHHGGAVCRVQWRSFGKSAYMTLQYPLHDALVKGAVKGFCSTM